MESKKKKIRVYELDFGDTNLIVKDYNDILDWIKVDLDDMGDSSELEYRITTKMITEKEFLKLPEWA